MTDRERKGQSNREDGALTRLRLHMERATETLDLGCHNVHADAAASLLGDGACSREPRLEDELHRILIAKGLSGRGEPESRALVADGFQVHAASVIRQADHDLGAFAMQFEDDPSR